MQKVLPKIITSIRTRQLRLRNYQSYDIGHPPMPEAMPSFEQLRLITSVQLFIGNEQQCSMAQQILRHTQNILRLSLHVSVSSIKSSNPHSDLQTFLAVITRIAGRDSAGGGATQPLQLRLRALTLTAFEVGECHLVLLNMIDPALLKVLETRGCTDVLTFYDRLAGNTRALRSIVNSGNRHLLQQTPEGLERLLTSCTGIETIRSAEPSDCAPSCSWAAVQRQGATLRVFEIDYNLNICNLSKSQGLDAFSDMCIHCPRLEELATAYPEPEWRQKFLVRIESPSKTSHRAVLTMMIGLPESFDRPPKLESLLLPPR